MNRQRSTSQRFSFPADKMYPVSDTPNFAARYRSGDPKVLKRMHNRKQRQYSRMVVAEAWEEVLEAHQWYWDD